MSSLEMDPEFSPEPAELSERARCETWAELVQTYGATMDDFINSHLDASRPVGTGMSVLDDALSGGLRPGVSILGGEPGAGKSAFALQMAVRHIFAHQKAVYITLEMDRNQTMTRALSNYANMNESQRAGLKPFRWSDAWSMGSESRTKLDAATNDEGRADIMHKLESGGDPVIAAAKMFEARYQNNLLIIDGPTAADINVIEDIAKDAKYTGATLFVIDYLQLMVDTEREYINEYENVSSIVKYLSDLGHDLDMPILALSSLNRIENAGMHGFKGSGDIEFCAEVALKLNNPKAGKDAEDQPDGALYTMDGKRPVVLSIVKNRRGLLKNINLMFDGAHNTFEVQEQ